MSKLSAKTLLIIFLSLLIAIVVLWKFVLPKQQIKAAWWNEGWNYRREISIGYTGSTTATNTRIKILSNYDLSTLVTSGKIQSDLDDLRFTDINGNLINYWIEDSTNNSVDIWGNVSSLYNPNTTIYMYYGNPSAKAESDTTSIFGTSVNPAGLNCSDIRNHHNSAGGNGVYWLDTDGAGANSPFQNYCDMTTNDGGWTLVMKLNGSLNTFEYASNYWTNTATYHPESSDFDNNEAKLQSYNTVAFDQVNLFMKDIGGTNLNKITINQTSSSLYTLISDGAYTATSIGRTTWLSLLEGVDAPLNCNKEGFNMAVSMTSSRIGMAMNGENDCNSCDNIIGFGNSKTGHPWGPYVTVGGGKAAVNPIKAAYGWIFVRTTLQNTDLSNLSINLSSTEEAGGGPVAYWKFDEGVGTTAYDSSSSQNHSILSGTTLPTWASEDQCISGKCLKFNGNANKVNTTSNISLVTPWTISFWTNISSSVSGNDEIFNGGNHNPRIWFTTNKLSVAYRNSSGTYQFALSSSNINFNQWYYFSLIWDGEKFTLYKDGKQDRSYTVTDGIYSTVNSPWLGGNWGNSINGHIDDVKIYPYARTAAQIKLDYNSRGSTKGTTANLGVKSNTGPSLSSKLVAYYKFDENNGTIVNNSGNGGVGLSGIFGTGNSAPTWTNNGKINKALSFDGVGSKINLPNNIVPVSNIRTNGVTYSAWIKTNNNTQTQRIIGQQISSGYSDYSSGGLGINSNGKAQMISYDDAGSYKYMEGTTTIQNNAWYHLVGTYNSSDQKMRIYINGKLEGTPLPITTFSRLYSNDSNRIGIKDNATPYPFNGLIDEVKIYNTALTDDEVKQDYNQGSAIQFGSTNQTIGGTTTSLEYCIPGDTSFCASPVAEWKMDEKVGTSIVDTSGNNNTGTIIGNTTWDQGKKGSSLNFKTGTDYVAIADKDVLGMSNAVTIEAWIKRNSAGLNKWTTILDKGSPWEYWLGFNASNYLSFMYNPGDSSDVDRVYSYSNTVINDNLWHHVVATYNKLYVKMYVDGIEIYSIGHTDTIYDGTGYITIGDSYFRNGGYDFIGNIDQVKIYNYARTPAQVAYDYNKGGPIGWWKMDECQGSTVYDWSGNGNNGTLTIGSNGTQNNIGTCQIGTSAAWTNGASGKFNSSLNFDGTDDYINLGNATNINITRATSISAWIYPKSLSGEKTIYRKEGQIAFNIIPPNLDLWLYNGSWSNTVSFNGGFSTSNWYHVVATWDGNYPKLYINGLLKATGAQYSSTLRSSSYPSYIGVWTNGSTWNSYWNGQIDDVRLYNYALTPEQIKQIYNGGAINFN